VLWIGLLSGTSADAVDAALVRIGDRPGDLELIAALEVPLPDALRARVHRAAEGLLSPRELLRLDTELGERFSDAARAVAAAGEVDLAKIEGIGSHGQTVGHFPEPGVRGSLQLGSPSVIHAATGLPIVHDFRAADLAVGGQGAPLTPFLHLHCFAAEDERRAVLNLGGFTNVTYLPGPHADRVIAFDPGPGNALLDRAARWASRGMQRFDENGGRAARGRALKPVLDELLGDPYFAMAPPKSTGHEHFGKRFFARARSAIDAAGGEVEDLFATLQELTVQSIVQAAERFFPEPVDRWLIYGGGVRNSGLRQRLEQVLAPAPVDSTDAHGIPHGALEAITFALLGWCSMRGLPGNLPSATGASRPIVLGSLTPPHAVRGG
jgi:anhydro-N-acetylmuramic acid kinase